jgi:hypothetical protein
VYPPIFWIDDFGLAQQVHHIQLNFKVSIDDGEI